MDFSSVSPIVMVCVGHPLYGGNLHVSVDDPVSVQVGRLHLLRDLALQPSRVHARNLKQNILS